MTVFQGRISAGVIGVGSMGRNHARVLSDLDVLAGISDVDFKTAGEMAKRFGAKAFEDYKELLNSDIEAVTIATPTSTHFQIAMDALDAGKHVLIEKPICSTIDESQQLIDKASSLGLTLGVGLIERHNPVVNFAKDAIAAGKFGDLVTVAARRVSSFPARIKDVGVIMDLGVHDIDVTRYLVGSPINSVFAFGGKQSNPDFEDHCNVLMDFEDGTTGFVEVNWLTPMKVRKISLTCMESFVELDYINQSAEISTSQVREFDPSNMYNIPIEFDIRNISIQKKEPLMNEHIDFLEAVINKTKPLVSGEDGLMTIKVCTAAIESMRSGQRVMME